MKKRVIIFVLMILAVFLSVSAVSAMDVNTVDSNSTVLTAADDSLSVGESNSNVSFSSSNVIEENNNNVIGDSNQQKAVNLDAPSIELYYKNGTRFMINLTDENGNGLANQTVSILINGVTYDRITDSNGSASIAVNLYSGLYHVTVSYKGTTEYAPASTTSEVKVMPTINSGDVTKFYKNGTQYYATFLDGHGNPLINTTVRFNINGVFYNRVTNDKGVAKLNIQLRPANYILTAYNPNNGYQCGYTIKVLPTVLAEDFK
nr:carboxypeptidase-like regulatory domain-containing protein [Methanobrevibacter smithii]